MARPSLNSLVLGALSVFFLALGAAFGAAPPLDGEADTTPPESLTFSEATAAAKAAMFGNPNAALSYADRAENLASPQTEQFAEALWLKADALNRLGQPETALTTIKRAETHLPALPSLVAGQLLLTKGRAYASINQQADSLLSLQAAFAIFSALDDRRGEAFALNGIATLYQDAKRYEQALEYYELASTFAGDKKLRYGINHNRADILTEIGKPSDAYSILQDNLETAKALDHPFLLGTTNVALARVAVEAGRVESARRHLKEAKRYANDPSMRAWLHHLRIVEALIAVADSETSKAKRIFSEIFKDYDFQKPDDRFADHHHAAYEFYESQNESDLALRHLEAFLAISSRADKVAADRNFALLDAEFEASRKDLEIEQLKNATLEADIEAAEREKRFQLVLFGVLAAGGAGVTALLLWHLRTMAAAARKLKRTNRDLEEAMEAKSQFLASTSHEIRTPLNAIIGMSEVILESPDLGAKTKANVVTIQEAGALLLGIVDDILDVAAMERREQTIALTPIDAGELVENLAALHSGNARRKNIDLDVAAEEDLPWFLTDPRLLKQAVGNLIANAVKFTEEGRVLVRVRAEKAHGLIVEVEDSGIGIPEDQLETIFESFKQVDGSTTRTYGGTGLGLTIVRHIAELLGGQVAVRSVLGEGSIFTLSVPARQVLPERMQDKLASFDEKTKGAADEGADSLSGLRVLLAEDNKVNQLVLTSMLAEEVALIEVAEDGRQAVEMAQKFPYDVVLMDYHMPNMSGLDAAEAIRACATLADLPIIGVTADAAEPVKAALLNAGMDMVISKPVKKDVLKSAIAALVTREAPRRQASS